MNSRNVHPIQVVPFDPKHLELIEVREEYCPGECPKTIMNTAFTFMKDGLVLAIIGGFSFVPGTIHFWALVSKYAKKYPVAFHKQCLDVVRWYERTEKPRRLQMDVRVGFDSACRWAEALGFEREGIMKNWGPNNEPFYLYGRAVPWQS